MRVPLTIEINGRVIRDEVDPRMLLVEFVREHVRLTGTHVGCDTSYCGACTLLVDGREHRLVPPPGGVEGKIWDVMRIDAQARRLVE